MSKGDTAKKVAIGAAVAGAVGYLAGILTAPKSGKETRKDIKDTAVKSWAKVEAQLKTLYTDLSKKIDEAKEYAGKVSGKSREELDKLVAVAKDKREKVREMLSAIHEGDADDADLADAVKEATAALDHLKSFLKK